MKLFLTILSTFVISFSAFADQDPVNGQYVEIAADDVFVPKGFDDNDEVVTVIDGFLPDGCYRLARPEIHMDQDTRTVKIIPMARWFDVPCIEARIPYSLEVRLGVLPMGDYQVKVGSGVNEDLGVAESQTAGPDDYLYAPVDSASVEALASGSRALIGLIEGRFTNSCMVIDEVRVINSGKTVEVLPIMKLEDRDDCVDGERNFKHSFVLPDLMNGRHLLHVRSLNGRDVNKMFTVNN